MSSQKAIGLLLTCSTAWRTPRWSTGTECCTMARPFPTVRVVWGEGEGEGAARVVAQELPARDCAPVRPWGQTRVPTRTRARAHNMRRRARRHAMRDCAGEDLHVPLSRVGRRDVLVRPPKSRSARSPRPFPPSPHHSATRISPSPQVPRPHCRAVHGWSDRPADHPAERGRRGRERARQRRRDAADPGLVPAERARHR